MDVSVIICTYNRSGLLKNELETIAAMTVPRDLSWEILIVDNNSSDNTRETVDDFIKEKNIPVKYIFVPAQGKSRALNSGIKEADGEILAFLDDDMLVDKNWLTAIQEAANRYPEASGFGGRILIKWPIRKPDWIVMEGPFRNIDGTVGHRDLGDKDGDFAKFNSLPAGGNMFFRKKVFLEGNFFRENMGPKGKDMYYGEDREFCLRLCGKGKKLYYVNNAVVYHDIPKEKIDRRYFCKRRFECGYAETAFIKTRFNGRVLFKIPVYLFKYFFLNGMKSIFSLNPAARFSYKLKLCSVLGQMEGCIKNEKN